MEDKMTNFVVSTFPTNDSELLGARKYTGTVVSKIECHTLTHIDIGPALEGLLIFGEYKQKQDNLEIIAMMSWNFISKNIKTAHKANSLIMCHD